MDSPQMYDNHQQGQSAGIGGGGGVGEVKKTVIMNSANNNNNNNLTTLNNNATGISKQTTALLKQHHHHLQQQYQQHGGELSDLNNPEISLDLQGLIDDSQFSEGLFSDILQSQQGKHLQNLQNSARQQQQVMGIPGGGGGGGGGGNGNYPRTTLAYMPQPVHSGATSYSATQNSNSDSNSSAGSDVPSIKEEPVDPQEFRRQACNLNALQNAGYMAGAPAYPGPPGAPSFAALTPSPVMQHQLTMNAMKSKSMMLNQHIARKSVKPCDKNSDEYRRRRERNNIAVRKSREKAKVRTRETEEKVKILIKENERLQKRIEMLTEELNVMRSLFSSVGVLPEHVHREISKQLDTFQQPQQHQQTHMSNGENRQRLLENLHDYGP